MRGRTSSLLLVPAVTAFLAACQTTFYDPGTTPITLSPTVVAGFEKYKQADFPLFFAVSTNGGGYSYSTCPSFNCVQGVEDRAIKNCEDRTGLECKIFAYERDVVWKGPVTYPGTRPDNYSLIVAVKDGLATTNHTGRAILLQDKTKLDLKVRIKGSECAGIANVETGKWELSCKNSKWFRGTFHPATENKFEGFGRGTDGVFAELLIPNLMPKQQLEHFKVEENRMC